MEKTGGYSLEDTEKVRRSTKAALRGLDKDAKNISIESTNENTKKTIEHKAEGKRTYNKLKKYGDRRIGANA